MNHTRYSRTTQMDGSSNTSRHRPGSFTSTCSVVKRCSMCKFTGGPNEYAEDELHPLDFRLCTESPRAHPTRATGWVQSPSEESNMDQITFEGAARAQPPPYRGMKGPAPPRLYSPCPISPRPYEFSRDLPPSSRLQVKRPNRPLNSSTTSSLAPLSISPSVPRLQSMHPVVDDDEYYAGPSYPSVYTTPPELFRPRTESRRPTASEVAEARHRDLGKRIHIQAQKDKSGAQSDEWKARLQHIKAAMAEDRRAREEVAEAKSNERKSAAMQEAAHMAIEASDECMREKKDGTDCETRMKALCEQREEAPRVQKERQQKNAILEQQQEMSKLEQRTLRELQEKSVREDREKQDQLDVDRLKNLQQEVAKWKKHQEEIANMKEAATQKARLIRHFQEKQRKLEADKLQKSQEESAKIDALAAQFHDVKLSSDSDSEDENEEGWEKVRDPDKTEWEVVHSLDY